MSDLHKEFQVWRERKGFSGIQSQEEVDQFLAERNLPAQVQKDVNQWPINHPECSIQSQPNKSLFEKYLTIYDLPATMENLEAAYEHLKRTGRLELVKVKPPIDPDKPQIGYGCWKNGRWIPYDTATGQGSVKTGGNMGQHQPGASGEDPIIRRRPEQMTAAEFEKACKSKAFRAKFDS